MEQNPIVEPSHGLISQETKNILWNQKIYSLFTRAVQWTLA
jgi:hypothetical protein